jgi:hypothetical protein
MVRHASKRNVITAKPVCLAQAEVKSFDHDDDITRNRTQGGKRTYDRKLGQSVFLRMRDSVGSEEIAKELIQ